MSKTPDQGDSISELDEMMNQQMVDQSHRDPAQHWVPSGRRLISGLLGLNVVLLGAALVAGRALNPVGLKHQEPQVFLLLLMSFSLVWMLWYLLWARKQPGISPHKDHHAGGITEILVLLLFAAFSLLLFMFRTGYLISMKECQPLSKILSPFFEAPFMGLQTYLLWAHSKDCIHRHKVITRSGLMLILSADLLLWLNAVTEDTIHQEIELEDADGQKFSNENATENTGGSALAGITNATICQCDASAFCLIFRKGLEVLYPFNIEYNLMAGCMIYVMWKNVARRVSPGLLPHAAHKLTLQIVYKGGILFGPLFGVLVLVVGVTIFILYQVWVSLKQYRLTAFILFYGYHLAVMPIMSLCSLVGLLTIRLERRAQVERKNPARSLDVVLLVGTALGQLALSYFSLVAALAVGTSWPLGQLDLFYSLLSLLELILQNIFIIEGLQRHPTLRVKNKDKRRQRGSIFKPKTKVTAQIQEKERTEVLLQESNMRATPAEQEGETDKSWTKRVIKEICAFLIFSNIMLWIIPAFGVHPQFENGLGKQFFGFTSWFVLVNLGQPLGVFYRMHSVGALMELLISA